LRGTGAARRSTAETLRSTQPERLTTPRSVRVCTLYSDPANFLAEVNWAEPNAPETVELALNMLSLQASLTSGDPFHNAGQLDPGVGEGAQAEYGAPAFN
jgi:hypothetical protein